MDVVFSEAKELLRAENLLLAGLPSAARRKVVACGEIVQLTFGDVICEEGERMSHIYFPVSSFFSIISSVDEHCKLEAGLVGAEGMLGISSMLGVDIAPGHVRVQGSGAALRLRAALFAQALKHSPSLEQALRRYMYVVMSQLARATACIHYHVVEKRFARWLLMTCDRAQSNTFYLTHEHAAYMLGVRRVGITCAATALLKRRLISYERGQVTIVHRAGLEKAACRCYGVAIETYARIMGYKSTMWTAAVPEAQATTRTN